MSSAPKPHEIQIQAAILQWLRLRSNIMVFAVPNGIRTTRFGALKAIREGLTKGAPDLVVCHASPDGPEVVFIEVKSAGGRLSPEQKRMQDWMLERGFNHLVARSLDDVVMYFEGRP